MGRATFEDMLNDPRGREIVRLFQDRIEGELTDEIKQYLLDGAQAAQLRGKQGQDWTRTAADLAQDIVDGRAHPAEYPLFWIRLYSIIFELFPRLDRHRELIEAVDFYEPVLAAADELMNRLSRDDRDFIRFMRISHAHMYVSYVRYGARREPEGSFVVVPPRDRRVEELARRIIAAHDADQQQVAASYATKIVGVLNQLAEAVRRANEA